MLINSLHCLPFPAHFLSGFPGLIKIKDSGLRSPGPAGGMMGLMLEEGGSERRWSELIHSSPFTPRCLSSDSLMGEIKKHSAQSEQVTVQIHRFWLEVKHNWTASQSLP